MCKRVSDEVIAALAAACPSLESLELGGCSHLTNDGLRALAAAPRLRARLRRLNLRSCWQITDAGIGHLAGIRSSTTTTNPHLDGDNEDDIGLAALEVLVLQDCQKLSDAALRMLQEGGSLRTLRSLNLSFCASITDSGLRSLGRLTALESLNLGLAYLAEASVNLASLDVSFCERVSDAGLGHIAGGLFSLRRLALAGCRRISDEGLGQVAKTLLDLDTLSVGQCVRIGDRSLELIAAHLRQLRRIDLYGCPRLSAAGVVALRAGLPRLSSMNLGLLQAPSPAATESEQR